MNDLNTVNHELVAGVKEMIRSRSLGMARHYAGIDDFATQPIEGDLSVYGHWMTLILVAGKAAKLTFKVHFMEEEAKKLATHVYARPPTDISTPQAIDFMKELCNLVAGSLKKEFQDSGVIVGISLPMVTRGFDEVFFPRGDGFSQFEDQWKVISSRGEFVCSSHFEVMDIAAVGNVTTRAASSQTADMGDVDFL